MITDTIYVYPSWYVINPKRTKKITQNHCHRYHLICFFGFMTIMTMIVHQIRNNMEHPKISKNTLNDVGISMGFPCENRRLSLISALMSRRLMAFSSPDLAASFFCSWQLSRLTCIRNTQNSLYLFVYSNYVLYVYGYV